MAHEHCKPYFEGRYPTIDPSLQLELDEESSEASCVVKMRQRNVIQGTKSALEIDDTVAHMLDLVIVTWVFVERRRRDQEYKDVGV